MIGIRTNDSELCGNVETQEVVDELEERPALLLHEAPCAGREDEDIPGSDGEGADKEVLLGREVRGEVEGGRERDRGAVAAAGVVACGGVARGVVHGREAGDGRWDGRTSTGEDRLVCRVYERTAGRRAPTESSAINAR